MWAIKVFPIFLPFFVLLCIIQIDLQYKDGGRVLYKRVFVDETFYGRNIMHVLLKMLYLLYLKCNVNL